ncbi:MAG: hypothetical protein LBS41_01530 [Streptococcaceae bacterium]|nr:hypothetical protein [Streptococcaceae bacterium]
MEIKTVLSNEELAMIKERYKNTIETQKLPQLEKVRKTCIIVLLSLGYYTCFVGLYRVIKTHGTRGDDISDVFTVLVMLVFLTGVYKLYKIGHLYPLALFPKQSVDETYQVSEKDVQKITHCVRLTDVLVLTTSFKKINGKKLLLIQKATNPEAFENIGKQLKIKLSKSQWFRRYWEEGYTIGMKRKVKSEDLNKE